MELVNGADLSKAFFQKAWGEGYYEHFSYGVGIDNVFEKCVVPFCSQDKTALEIGPGLGSFTEMMWYKFEHFTAIDVIKMPSVFNNYIDSFTYHELTNQSFDCGPVKTHSIDFCFSYNVFCHFSNAAIREYLKSVYKVLKTGGDFVFMISNYENVKKHVTGNYSLGDFLPMGHFYQDLRTLDLVVGPEWKIVNRNMIPEHRDILIHLKKAR
jgi:SAM-dependent methyltransferase